MKTKTKKNNFRNNKRTLETAVSDDVYAIPIESNEKKKRKIDTQIIS